MALRAMGLNPRDDDDGGYQAPPTPAGQAVQKFLFGDRDPSGSSATTAPEAEDQSQESLQIRTVQTAAGIVYAVKVRRPPTLRKPHEGRRAGHFGLRVGAYAITLQQLETEVGGSACNGNATSRHGGRRVANV